MELEESKEKELTKEKEENKEKEEEEESKEGEYAFTLDGFLERISKFKSQILQQWETTSLSPNPKWILTKSIAYIKNIPIVTMGMILVMISAFIISLFLPEKYLALNPG